MKLVIFDTLEPAAFHSRHKIWEAVVSKYELESVHIIHDRVDPVWDVVYEQLFSRLRDEFN